VARGSRTGSFVSAYPVNDRFEQTGNLTQPKTFDVEMHRPMPQFPFMPTWFGSENIEASAVLALIALLAVEVSAFFGLAREITSFSEGVEAAPLSAQRRRF
jgi:ABC-type microcin C transport system permease subunit YejE